jgi:hypothetical protein
MLSDNAGLDDQYNASPACRTLYDELSAYTLSLLDPDFIHQYIVDAYAASHSGSLVKPIRTAFALVGLYLAVERGYTGRQVQKAHMVLANRQKNWPRFNPPLLKPRLTVLDVLGSPPGVARNEKIRDWMRSVWEIWEEDHQRVRQLLQNYLYA